MRLWKSARNSGATSRDGSSTAFWTPSFTAAALLSLLIAPPLRGAAPAPAGPLSVGRAFGDARASYLLLCPTGVPTPPSMALDGFAQSARRTEGGWIVDVSASLTARRVRAPFRPGRLPSSLGLAKADARALEARLAHCQRAGEAVEAVLLHLRSRLAYEPRPDFDENLRSVFERGRASCVGFTRAAAAILGALGIPCREVVGLRYPPGASGDLPLSGGVLHAWIEWRCEGSDPVFCDPLTSTDWVGETYVALKVGRGLDAGDLAALKGGVLRPLERKDRIFFEPDAGTGAILWARRGPVAQAGASLMGKLLGAMDAPLEGRAELEGAGAKTSMDLWEGNFFFVGLAPGTYDLTVITAGAAPKHLDFSLSGMDKRTVVLYSRGAGGGTGATDEPRR